MKRWLDAALVVIVIGAVIYIFSFSAGVSSLRETVGLIRKVCQGRCIGRVKKDKVFTDTFDENKNWAFNGDYGRPNFASYPGIRGWENGPLTGEQHAKNRPYLNIVDGVVSGCSRGYGPNPQSFEPTSMHREIDIDGSKGFFVEFRAISAADWPNCVTVRLVSDWQRGRKKQKYYGFRIYGESSNHTIDLLSTSLDSFSDTLYRHKVGSLVNSWHTYGFRRLADGTFELLVDGTKMQSFKPPADRTYNRFNRIGIVTLRSGSKIDWIRVGSLDQASAGEEKSETIAATKCISKPESKKGRTFAGDESGGRVIDAEAGWDGDFETYAEARSNGNRLAAITWETTEIYRIPRRAKNVRLRAKTEHMNWQSHGGVYVYDFAEEEYILVVGGEKAGNGTHDNTIRLEARHVRDGAIKLRALLFAKHSTKAYARYYESAILYDLR